MTRRVRPFVLLTLAALAVAAGLRAAEPARWWSPGDGGRLPAYATYANDYGEVGVLNSSGPIDTKGHPFFEPIGDERPRLRELSSARQRACRSRWRRFRSAGGRPRATIRSSPPSTA